MSAPTVTGDAVRGLVDAHLDELRRLTGLPAMFGGAVEGGRTERIVVSELRGTLSTALDGLAIQHGRGLGGLALAQGRPYLVSDYRTNRTITHHFDQQVVDVERLTGVFAFPLKLDGRVVGVLYGASRDDLPIGDVAVRRTAGAVRTMEAELTRLAAQRREPRLMSTSDALAELREVAARQSDPALRARLMRAHHSLAGPAAALPANVRLAPREQQCLALVATGATNAQIATELGLTVETVKTYLRNAMRRLEVGNRTAAAHVARTAGLI